MIDTADAAATPSTLGVLRYSRGLTQAQLAERAHISRETVSRLERGATPHLKTARTIAATLGFPVDVIFPQDDGEPADAPAPVTTSGGQARYASAE